MDTLKPAYAKLTIMGKSRTVLLFGQSINNKSMDPSVCIFTTYNNLHALVKKYINQYWHLLTSDSKIAKYISKVPQITYRQTPSDI